MIALNSFAKYIGMEGKFYWAVSRSSLHHHIKLRKSISTVLTGKRSQRFLCSSLLFLWFK